MKKLLLTLTAITFVGSWAYAQNEHSTPLGKASESITAPKSVNVSPSSTSNSGSEAVLWTEDFSQGFAGSPNGQWNTRWPGWLFSNGRCRWS
ncbi:MAG: hypothetical protein U5L96_18930 [Owenweeksia sp.]|nr:hypothetical protein [Owenweeksia sp.]